jgi:aerobic carbon-monoxide dehydrogenase large subunit
MTQTEASVFEKNSRLVGSSPRRKDAPQALTGTATYTADIELPGMLYASIYRSPHAHARIRNIDLSRALALRGVITGLTGRDLPDFVKPFALPAFSPKTRQPITKCLAVDKARYVGEALAVVVATDPYIAEDALEFIDADFDPLPAVVDAEKGLEWGAPILYEDWGDNVIIRFPVSNGDVNKAFKGAPHIFKETIRSSRFTTAPIEPPAAVASYDPASNRLEVWVTTQFSHTMQGLIRQALAIPGLNVRVIVPRMGGAFGGKGGTGLDEVTVSLMAYLTKRPVKCVATRTDHLTGRHHAREQVHHLEIAVTNDGTILGLKDRIIADAGVGYNRGGLSSIKCIPMYVPGVYRIQNFEAELFGVATNKAYFGAHRGFGKADAAYVIERLIDIVARKLKIDPVEIRKKNFIQPEEFPYWNATGSRYDSGNYEATLDKALGIIDYPHWRREQEKARGEGRWLGIGIAVVVEGNSSTHGGAGTYYSVRIRMEPSGEIRVFPCGNDDGGGHGTAIAQIVADEIGVSFENVSTIEGDSLICPFGSGSYSSRFSILGASAVIMAARQLKKKICAIAATLLKVKPEDVAIEAGRIHPKGASTRGVSFQDVARIAYVHIHRLPENLEPGLELVYHYRDPNVSLEVDERGREQGFSSFAYAADVAVVEIDPGTGKLEILKYVSVHDCGNMINPKEVYGQHTGALAHGIGGAMYEEIVYDENGQPLVQNFKDYLIPTAVEVPHFVLDHTITPNPFTPGGFKGAGETGAISPPPCLANALEDALSPLKVEIRTLPLKPDLVWHAMRSKTKEG